jgi:hypothetical protein
MRWYSTSLMEPMLHFSCPKNSVKLKAQSNTGSANSNPKGESRPIAIFGFVPNAFPIVKMTVERPFHTNHGRLDRLLRPAAHHESTRKIDSTFVLLLFQGSNQFGATVEPAVARINCVQDDEPEVPISQRIKFASPTSLII